MDLRHRMELSQPVRRKPRRRVLRWLGGLLLLAVLALFAFGIYLQQQTANPPAVSEPAAPGAPEGAEPSARAPALPTEPVPPAPTGPETEPASPPDEPLPPLAESDPLVRDLARGLSSGDGLGTWLAAGGLIQRFVAVVDNVADGQSPTPNVRFLAPAATFGVKTQGERVYVDPKTYARYDGIADVIASLDPHAAVQLFRRLQPLCEDAYHELGHPDGHFEDALGRSVRTLLATPIVEGDVELVPKVVTYGFADPRLEGLSPAQKHLLRMGPRNVRLIQGQLRAMVAALALRTDVPPPAPPAGVAR